MEKVKVKRKIYADDSEFRILELDYGKKLYEARGEDKMMWEKVSFDVWNDRFLGWLDIYIGRNGDGGWHFFESDINDPSRVRVYYGPMKIDLSDRDGLFKKVCGYAKYCYEESFDENQFDWKKSTVPIEQRVEEQFAISV